MQPLRQNESSTEKKNIPFQWATGENAQIQHFKLHLLCLPSQEAGDSPKDEVRLSELKGLDLQ